MQPLFAFIWRFSRERQPSSERARAAWQGESPRPKLGLAFGRTESTSYSTTDRTQALSAFAVNMGGLGAWLLNVALPHYPLPGEWG